MNVVALCFRSKVALGYEKGFGSLPVAQAKAELAIASWAAAEV